MCKDQLPDIPPTTLEQARRGLHAACSSPRRETCKAKIDVVKDTRFSLRHYSGTWRGAICVFPPARAQQCMTIVSFYVLRMNVVDSTYLKTQIYVVALRSRRYCIRAPCSGTDSSTIFIYVS